MANNLKDKCKLLLSKTFIKCGAYIADSQFIHLFSSITLSLTSRKSQKFEIKLWSKFSYFIVFVFVKQKHCNCNKQYYWDL